MFSEYRDYKQFLIYIYDPLIFDLMTLKSTQFIGSARFPELNSNPSICSNDNTITSYFLSIHNEPHDLDLYLMTPKSNQFISSASNIHDLSLAGIHQSVLEIRRSRAVFAYTMCAVTFDLVTPKSNQFIGFARYIHDQSLAGIHQSVLQITRSQAVFAYIMSPVTFDL